LGKGLRQQILAIKKTTILKSLRFLDFSMRKTLFQEKIPNKLTFCTETNPAGESLTKKIAAR